MFTFDALTLKAFTKESEDFFIGARIQKIQQPTRRDLIIFLRNNSENRKLYININPQMYHICFMSKENEEKRRLEIPKKPPMFCMLLRKYLENSKVCEVNVPNNERILELYIESFNELNEKIKLCLAIELMGKHSNIILYNADTNIIIGCAHNVGAEKSREREVAGTLPYVYPPSQNKLDISEFKGTIDSDRLSNDFYLFSKSFAKLCSGKDIESLRKYVSLETVSPAISEDFEKFSLYGELLLRSIPQNGVNSMIDNYFAYHQEKELLCNLKSNLLTLVHQNIKKTANSVSKLSARLDKDAECDKYRLYGDLIMANLYNNSDYVEKIEVYDYENGKNISIDLDGTKTLKDNANRFYKLYNKGKTAKIKLTEFLNEYNQIQNNLEQTEYFLDIAQTYEELIPIRQELLPEKVQEKLQKNALEPQKIQKGDYTIYIGKNNRQNDYIVSKLAKDEDLWFHTRNCAGSHVLLKGNIPSDELILECAKLAKKYSSAADSTKTGVIYTKAKYLKKPPKAPLGYVTYKNEKEIVTD